MKDVYVKVTREERMRLQAAVLDRDKDEALAFAKLLLDRLEEAERSGIRSHLDR